MANGTQCNAAGFSTLLLHRPTLRLIRPTLRPSFPSAYSDTRTSIHGGGIGIDSRMLENGYPVVVSVFPQGPAAKAGMQVEVDYHSIYGSPFDQIIVKLRGLVGTIVHVTVTRNHQDYSFDIARELVNGASHEPAPAPPSTPMPSAPPLYAGNGGQRAALLG
jgi:hypothetical protein